MTETRGLGRIEKIEDLREAWPDETADFTPWLAEHIAELGNALRFVRPVRPHVRLRRRLTARRRSRRDGLDRLPGQRHQDGIGCRLAGRVHALR